MVEKEKKFGGSESISTREKGQVISALDIPVRGEVHSLSQVMDLNSPIPSFHGPYNLFTYHSLENQQENWSEDYRAMNVRLEMTDHHGTHIDSLNHIGIGYKLYNEEDGRRITTERGTTKLGIETVSPIVTRGVLVDVAKNKGIEILDSDCKIDVDDVEKSLETTRINPPGKGDVVLFRTGYGKLWGKENSRYLGPPVPGISEEVANWAIERGVVAVGADTSGVEYILEKDPPSGHRAPVHQKLITEAGIHIIENLMLESLSRSGFNEFLFICTPLKLRGATASPINPIAIV